MGKTVVLDGPAGSGKSTTAIELAKRLGYIYLDTGAMYRALTLKCLRLGKTKDNLRDNLDKILKDTSIRIEPVAPPRQGLKIILDREDVTAQIRSNDVDGFVSEVAAVDEIREYMQALQRQFARDFNIVAEGRDLGTYVFPHADVKIFLVADLDIRAKRRMLQKDADEEALAKFRENLAKRDLIDSGRQHSPLKKADDAIEVDTTDLTFEEQVQKILEICRQKLK
jgi:cytidylate kinase